MKIRRTMVAGLSPSVGHPNSPPPRSMGARMTRTKEKGCWWIMKSTTSGEDDDESQDEESGEMAAIAIVSTPYTSIFNSQIKNSIITNHKCRMAKAIEVTSSTTPSSSHSTSIPMDDVSSLKIKKEQVSSAEFIANMKGHIEVFFETLMCQLGDAHDTIKEKEEFERLATNDIGSLSIELKEEENLRASLEEKILGLE
jgi:hypothetical protein